MKIVFLTLILIAASKQDLIDHCGVIPGSKEDVKGDVFLEGDMNLKETFENIEPSRIFDTNLKFKCILVTVNNDDSVIKFAIKRMKKEDVTDELILQNEDFSEYSFKEDEYYQCQIDNQYIYVVKSFVEMENESEAEVKNLIDAQDTYESLCSVMSGAEGDKVPLSLQDGLLAGDKSFLIEHFKKGPALPQYFGHFVKLEIGNVKLAIRETKPDVLTPQRLKIIRELSAVNLVPTFRGCVWNGQSVYLVQDEMKQDLLSDGFTEQFKSFKLWQKAEFFVKLAEIVIKAKRLGYSIRELTAFNVMVDESLTPKLAVVDWIVPLGTLDTDVLNEAYAAPWREKNNPVDETLDAYSLSTIILVLTGGIKEKIFILDADLEPNVENWVSLRKASLDDRLKAFYMNMLDVVQESWGDFKMREAPNSKLSITSILFYNLTSKTLAVDSESILLNLKDTQSKLEAENKLLI